MNRPTEAMDMPRRAFSYVRWSSAQQRAGRSNRRQRDWAPEICKREGWLLDDAAHWEDAGKSAFRGKNSDTGALGAFLADVKAGIIPRGSVLLVESLDRLSRDEVDEAYELFRKLLRGGISIRTREPDRYYEAAKSTSMLELLEVLFIFARAHEESAVKSMRISDVWGARRRAAADKDTRATPRFPWWLEKTAAGFTLHPVLAPAARHAFLRSADGIGIKRLVRELAERFDVAPSGPGGAWRQSTLARLLHNRAALGELQPHQRGADGVYRPAGEPVEGYYPSLVTTDEFAAAQMAAQGRRRRTGRPAVGPPNLFTGLAWHAGFGERVCLITTGDRAAGRSYGYLGLRPDARAAVRAQVVAHWRYDFFESAILDAIEELSLADVLPPGPGPSAAAEEMRALAARALRLDQRARTLQALAESPDADEQAASDAFASRQRVLREHKEVAARLAKLKMETSAGGGDSLARAQSLVEAWRGEQPAAARAALADRLKAALSRLVESVWVLPQRLTRQRTALHVQIYLRSGVRRPLLILPTGGAAGRTIWDLSACDFRAGDVGDKGSDSQAAS